MRDFARRHGLFMLDDAAQALGARYQGRPVGSFGDAGLFSFDKGKNITTLQGGVLVAGSGDLRDALDSVTTGLLAASPVGTLGTLCKLPLYALLLRPWAYGAVRRLPLGLGTTPYEPDYPIAPYSRALAGLAALQLARLGEYTGVRVRNAGRLREALGRVAWIFHATRPAGRRASLCKVSGFRGAATSRRGHSGARAGWHRRHGLISPCAHGRTRSGAPPPRGPTTHAGCPRSGQADSDPADPRILAA
ncbi:MAG: DegT/DnrJ/EryC1/StrS family aminotransferase [Steroidobacteraceae bacterium]